MRAIVCDKCGKVMLLDEEGPMYGSPSGAHQLIGKSLPGGAIDLCEECVEKLVAAIRKE